MTADEPPIQQHDGAVLIQTAPMLAAAYQATLAGIRRRRADGLPAGDLQQLARTLRRAHHAAMSGARHKDAGHTTGGPCSHCQHGDPVGVGEAALLLGVSRRQTQRLAAGNSDLGGVRVGKTWVLDRGAVLALAAKRKARR